MAELAQTILDDFHKAAKSAELEYLLIGGFAVSYWSTPRFTADVDYVVAASSFEKAKEAAGHIGYRLEYLHPKGSFAHFSNAEAGGFRIDFMIVDESTWRKLKSDAAEADIGGTYAFPIVSPLHLVAMKLHAARQSDRADIFKDLNDAAEILVAQNLTFKELENADILDKYGSKETIGRLREIVEAKRGKKS